MFTLKGRRPPAAEVIMVTLLERLQRRVARLDGWNNNVLDSNTGERCSFPLFFLIVNINVFECE